MADGREKNVAEKHYFAKDQMQITIRVQRRGSWDINFLQTCWKNVFDIVVLLVR